MKKLIGRIALLVAMVASMGLILSQQASAVDLYWDVNGATAGTGGTGAWNPTSNFWLDPVNTVWDPWTPNDGTTVAYFGGTAGTVTVSSPILRADSLVFTVTGYTVAASTLTLMNNANVTVNPTFTATISSAIAGTAGLNKTGTGALTLSGTNTYTGTTTVSAGTLTLGANNVLADASFVAVNGGTLDVNTRTDTVAGVSLQSGSITSTTGTLTSNSTYDMQSGTVSAILAGSLGLNKTTAGTVTLSKANTYTGLTNITAGTLAYGITNAIGAGAVTVNGATAVLDMGASYTDSVGAVILDGGGSITGTGTSTLTSTAAWDVRNGSVSAILAGTAGLNKTTAGTVTLSGVNTYTGTTTITEGTLAYGITNAISTGAVTVNGATAVLDLGASHTDSVGAVILDGGGSITGTGTSALTGTAAWDVRNGSVSAILAGTQALNKTTAGTVTLTGANTYSGITTVGGGTLKLDFSAAGAAATQIINAASVLTMGGAPSLGGGTLLVVGNATGNDCQTFASTTINAGASSIQFTNSVATGTPTLALKAITRNAGGTVDFKLPSAGAVTTTNANVGGILGGYATVGGTDWAANDGSGNIIALASYSPTWVTNANVDCATAGTTTSGALTINSLRINANTGTTTLGGATTITTGGILETAAVGANDVTITGSTLTGTGLTVIQNNTSGSLTIASQIIGANTLTKSGDGTLILTAANTYTGTTYVNAGTLAYGASNVISTGGVTVNGATAVLDMGNNQSDSVGTVIVDGGGQILGTGTSTLTSTAAFDVRSGSVSAILNGTSGLNKTTAGTVTLSGANTYTGLTSITAGTLAYGASDVISTGAVTVNGATAVLDMGLNHTDSVGTVIVNGGGQILGTGTSTLTSTAAFDMQNGSVSAILAGASGLNKTSANTVALSGANTYTGTTSVSAGTLNMNAVQNSAAPVYSITGGTLTVGVPGALQSTADVTVNGGTLAIGANNDTINSLLLQTGSITGTTGVLTASSWDLRTGTIGAYLAGTPASLNKNTAGTLTLGLTNALPINTQLTVSNGTFALGANSQNVYSFSLQGGASLTGAGTGANPAKLISLSAYDMQDGTDTTAILSGYMGLNKTTTGTVTLNGTYQQYMNYTGTTRIDCGTLAYGGYAGTASLYSDVIVNSGGTLSTAAGLGQGVKSLTLNGGTVTGTGTVQVVQGNIDARSGTVSAPMSGLASPYNYNSLIKTTGGTVTLTKNVNPLGCTLISAGTLVLDFTQPTSIASQILTSGSEFRNHVFMSGSGNLLVLGNGVAGDLNTFGGYYGSTFEVYPGSETVVFVNTGANSRLNLATSPAFSPSNAVSAKILRSVGGVMDFSLPDCGTITIGTTANLNPTGGSQTILGG